MLEASKKENISLNGVEIEDTFAEIFTMIEISPAQSLFSSSLNVKKRILFFTELACAHQRWI